MAAVADQIKDMINAHHIVLFMKGTPDFPQCGFSGQVTHILKACDVEFSSVNVLADPDIRQGIKDYANWPTIPQLYVSGEFIGGCDIVTDMYESGQLQALLKK